MKAEKIAVLLAFALISSWAAPLAAESGKKTETVKKTGFKLLDYSKNPDYIPAGYRAMTLPVAAHQLVGLGRGDRVDVMVSFDALVGKGEPQSKEKVTATLLQNVVVYRVHKPESAVELIVNPNEAQYAALAIDLDSAIWMIRRDHEDTEMNPMEMASFKKLFR